MKCIHGFVNLTDRNLYFQEVSGTSSNKVCRAKLISLKKVLKRRYQLSYCAIEIEAQNQNFYFNFKESSERDDFYNILIKHVSSKCLTEKNLSQVTQLWKNRLMSNFDYLMSINYIAQRSLNDFTQYPVMPWLIKEFDSNKIDTEDESIYRYFYNPQIYKEYNF